MECSSVAPDGWWLYLGYSLENVLPHWLSPWISKLNGCPPGYLGSMGTLLDPWLSPWISRLISCPLGSPGSLVAHLDFQAHWLPPWISGLSVYILPYIILPFRYPVLYPSRVFGSSLAAQAIAGALFRRCWQKKTAHLVLAAHAPSVPGRG